MESGVLREQDPERVRRSRHGVVAAREGRLCRVRSVGDAQSAGRVRQPEPRKGWGSPRSRSGERAGAVDTCRRVTPGGGHV